MRFFLFGAALCSMVFFLSCGEDKWDCVPGDVATCECSGGGSGAWECSESGEWGACEGCAACTPGKVETCPCIGGGEGVQECLDGNSWGECMGCEETASTDECEYNECVGEICEEPDDCCEGSACGSWYYQPEYGFSENYCFPMCDFSSEPVCQCGDQCVDFGDGFAVCLPEGGFLMENQKIAVAEDFESSFYADASESVEEAYIGDTDLPLSTVYAYWWESESGDDRWLVINSEGVSLMNQFWSVSVYIPEATFEKGVGTYPFYTDDGEDFNFMVEVQSGSIGDDDMITELWLEAFVDDAELEITSVCEPCAADDLECDECEFSVAALFFGMKSKLDY